MNFFKAQFIITNDFNHKSEEPLWQRPRNEKLGYKALHVLHFHKVHYEKDSIHFNRIREESLFVKKSE